MRFKIYHHESYGDEPEEFSAPDAESAATMFAEAYDSDGDFLLSQGAETTVVVESPDGTKRAFTLRAEQSIEYYAEPCPVPTKD